MKVAFLQSKFRPEEKLAWALKVGISRCGDEVQVFRKSEWPDQINLDVDLVAFVGLKNRIWYERCRQSGQRWMYLDKGYHHRHVEDRHKVDLWRVSIDAQQPLEFLKSGKQPDDRWLKLGREIYPWQVPRPHGHIVVANSSCKYHDFFNLPGPVEWAEQIVAEIRKYTDRPIWYRPKPSQMARSGIGNVHIEGTEFCPYMPLSSLFTGCHALITHGSYISVDALIAGVPGIILGPAATQPISSQTIAEIENPRRASDEERWQLLSNLAYCQYTPKEWTSGFAWRQIKQIFQLT